MSLGAITPTAPVTTRRPLLAVLDEIQALREQPELDAALAEELDSLEHSVRRILVHVHASVEKPAREPLSRRELHVLKQLAAGMSNKQIARRLAISEKTVRNHLTHVFTKLDVTNRTEAVIVAMREGLVTA